MRLLLIILFTLTSAVTFADTTQELLVQQLNEKGFDVYYASNSGDNALHMAAKKQDFEAVTLLLEYGFNPTRQNKTGNTALHFAAEKGDLAICQLLIDAGASVSTTNELEQTPYHKALHKKQYDVMSLLEANGYTISENTFQDQLIAMGVSPNKVDNSGNSLLHRLANTGNLELMRAALENGVNSFTQNKKGNTPLTLAINNRDLEMVQLLVDYNTFDAHYEYLRNTMTFGYVYQATKMVWTDGVEILLEATKDRTPNYINLLGENGVGILHQACAKGDLALVKLLVEYGANVNQITYSEYIYGERDPHNWSHDDWSDWGDVGVGGFDLYKQDSGYRHPVASPLAIARLIQPGAVDLHQYLIERGATWKNESALGDENLWEYLE